MKWCRDKCLRQGTLDKRVKVVSISGHDFKCNLGGVYMGKLALAQVSYRAAFFIPYRVYTWWLAHFISCYFKVHFMLIKYTCDWKSQTLRMQYPFESSGRFAFTWYLCEISCPGTTTRVNSRRVTCTATMTFCGGIMWTNLEPWEGTGVNSRQHERPPWCHVNTPLN